MIELSKGINFEDYLNKCTEEQRAKLIKSYESTKLSSEVSKAISEIDKEVKVVVFSEGYCPDCTVTIPFVKRIQELNSNIKAFYYSREGNEELLKEYTGTARIPTIMTFSKDMEPKGAYVEVPQPLAEKIAKLSVDDQDDLIEEYRQGKYNDLIEKELLHIIK